MKSLMCAMERFISAMESFICAMENLSSAMEGLELVRIRVIRDLRSEPEETSQRWTNSQAHFVAACSPHVDTDPHFTGIFEGIG